MKKKLIVMASTFPRWKNDTNPPFVYELSKRLTPDFDVTVLAPHYPEAKTYEEMDGMKVYRFRYFFSPLEKLAGSGGMLPMLKKNPLYYFEVPFFLLGEYLALRKLVKKIKPDIIHAHWIMPQGLIAVIINKTTKVPYVVTSHGSDLMGLKKLIRLKKYVLKNAKKITVVSNALKDEVHKIDSKLKVEVIPMGVDTKLFNPDRYDFLIKKKYGITGPFLLFVGRLAPEKGIEYLVDAMPMILEKAPKTKLMIIGDGQLMNQLKQKVKYLKIQDHVIFMGSVQNKDLPKYYATADIFISPSIREGFGLTFVEAGLSGCKLIGTNQGGIGEIISDVTNSVKIKNADSFSIFKAFEDLNKISFNDLVRRKNNLKLKNKFEWNLISLKYKKVLK